MQKIYVDIKLDFSDNESFVCVRAKQNESSGRIIRAALYYNGERINIDSTSGDTATVHASVGGVITVSSRAVTFYDNMVIIPITEELSALAGNERCEIRIKNSDNTAIRTAVFYISVGKNAAASDLPEIISTDDLSERVDELEEKSAKTEIAYNFIDYTLARIINAESYQKIIVEVTQDETLYQQWYLLPNNFNDSYDALITRKNGELIPLSSYTFTQVGATRQVTFPAGTFATGDKVTLEIYKNPVQSRVPDGYTELDYLEFDGYHAINSGFRAQYLAFEFDLEMTRSCNYNNDDCLIFGGYNSDPGPYDAVGRALYATPINGSLTDFHLGLWWYDGSALNAVMPPAYTTGTRYNVSGSYEDTRMKLTVDGSTVVHQIAWAGTPRDVWLASGGNTQYGCYKLYSAKLYDGETLGRDFVPAQRDSDGANGLYDLVNNTFYTLQS